MWLEQQMEAAQRSNPAKPPLAAEEAAAEVPPPPTHTAHTLAFLGVVMSSSCASMGGNG